MIDINKLKTFVQSLLSNKGLHKALLVTALGIVLPTCISSGLVKFEEYLIKSVQSHSKNPDELAKILRTVFIALQILNLTTGTYVVVTNLQGPAFAAFVEFLTIYGEKRLAENPLSMNPVVPEAQSPRFVLERLKPLTIELPNKVIVEIPVVKPLRLRPLIKRLEVFNPNNRLPQKCKEMLKLPSFSDRMLGYLQNFYSISNQKIIESISKANVETVGTALIEIGTSVSKAITKLPKNSPAFNGYKNDFNLSEFDNFSKYAGFGFDASILEIMPILFSGGSLHIIEKCIKLDTNKLNEYFEKNNITFSFLPTQFSELFIQETDNQSLKYLFVGGDKLKKIRKRNYKIINAYGPSETTVVCTNFEADRSDYSNIPIGKPIDNCKIYIVDQDLNLCPTGIAGELCISGHGIGLGYINLPETNKEKFILNPFSKDNDYSLVYKSGDLAKWLPDGNIEFLGRIDFQVKIRGFRI